MVTAHTKVQTAKTSGSLIDELISKHALPRLKDDDVTIPRVMAKSGWGELRCKRILKEEGYVPGGKVIDEHGHKVTVYRRPITLQSTNRV